ncbi:MAG: sigma-70 family RNA polymerase sigma factor [Candidatus Wallbacteria bacterium]|nr:sigma-70 family RNA polymerase sigma factor [Candidatus Wallbacteria bacterium]
MERTDAMSQTSLAATEEVLERQDSEAVGGFDDAFRRFRQPLLAFFSRRTTDGGAAENLLQETFLKAFRYWHTYDPSRRLSAWLFGIAGNLYRDWLHEEPRHSGPTAMFPQSAGDLALSDPEELAVERSARDAVREAIETLPEKYRTVLLMKHLQQMKYRDMAEELGLNEGTVKSRLNTAASLLREKLRREGWLS